MKEEIETKLEKLDKYVDELKNLSKQSLSEFKDDKIKQAAVERFFQMSIEVVLDISSMIISQENLEKPDNYRKMILALGKSEILENDFAENFANIAGFRNILVHQYTNIDVEIVYKKLKEKLEDFDKFARQIAIHVKEK